jgi:hypothetical protein
MRTTAFSSFCAFVLGICFIPLCSSTLGAQAVNYSVPEPTFAIKQVKTMGCWATAAAILASWKAHSLLSVEDVLKSAGGSYQEIYKGNLGLFPVDETGFLKALKLKAEPPASYTPQGIESKLRLWGPLFVTTAETNGRQVFVHARVILSIIGDGTGPGTQLTIADPDDGQRHLETLTDFVTRTETLAKLDYGISADVRPLIVHF